MDELDSLLAPPADELDKVLAPEQPAPAGFRQNTGLVGDLGTSLKRGVLELPGTAAGIVDLPIALATGARPVDKLTDIIGKVTGFRPSKWSEEAKAAYSPGYQAAQQDINTAWEDPNTSALDVAKAYVRNPAYTANLAAESVPSMLAGGLVSKGVMLAGRVATSALPAVEGVIARQGVGTLERKLAERAVAKLPPLASPEAIAAAEHGAQQTAVAIAGGAGEGIVQAGQAMDQSTGEDQRKNAIAALVSGVIDAIIGAGAGKVAQKLGFETAETAMATSFNNKVQQEVETGLAKYGRTGRVVGGALSEGVLQELPQSAQEQVFQNYADGKPLWEGVPRNAVEGALPGFAMGAGANVRGGKTSTAKSQETVTPENPATQKAQAALIDNVLPEGASVGEIVGDKATIVTPDGTETEKPVAELMQDILTDKPITTSAAAPTFVPLPQDPEAPGLVRYEAFRKDEKTGERPTVGTVYEFAPKEGQPVEEMQTALGKIKNDYARFKWLEKNATLVKRDQAGSTAADLQRNAQLQTDAEVRKANFENIRRNYETQQAAPSGAESAGMEAVPNQQVAAGAVAPGVGQEGGGETSGRVGTETESGTSNLPTSGSASPSIALPKMRQEPGTGVGGYLHTILDGPAAGATFTTETQAPGDVSARARALIAKYEKTQPITDGGQNDQEGQREGRRQGLLETPLQESAPSASGEPQLLAPVQSPRAPQGASSEDNLKSAKGLTNPLRVTSAQVPKFKSQAEVTAFKENLRAKGYDGVFLTDKQRGYALDAAKTTGETVVNVVKDTKAYLGSGFDNLVRNGKLEVVQSIDDAKATGIPMRGANGKVAGIYNKNLGMVVLIADNIEKGDGKYVMIHEGAHAILREDPKFVKQHSWIISDFMALAEASESVRVAIARVPEGTGLREIAPGEMEVYDELSAARRAEVDAIRQEEALAHWLQDRTNHEPNTPTGRSVAARLKALYNKFLSVVKSALFRAGLPYGRFTEAELAQIFTGGVQAWAQDTSALPTQTQKPSASLLSAQQAAKAFYSRLQGAVFADFPAELKAQKVIPYLKSKLKNTNEQRPYQEVQAIGLDAWIAAKKPADIVTREELTNFVRANMVETEDVVLGGDGNVVDPSMAEARVNRELDGFGYRAEYDGVAELFGTGEYSDAFNYYDIATGEKVAFNDMPAEAQEAVSKLVRAETYFETYTEPNADPGSYREMFVTAPKVVDAEKESIRAELQAIGLNATGDVSMLDIRRAGGSDALATRWFSAFMQDKTTGEWQDGHSQYSDIKNPIVRIRFNTETRDGKTYLRVEEMQGPSDDNQSKMPAYLRENIYQIAVKRVLAQAKEMGVDGIVFAQKESRTAGETQADRYSLEKVIDSIDWTKHGKKSSGFTYTINAHSTVGEDIKKSRITREELVATIGKEAADKIENNVGYAESDQYGAHGKLDKVDLKVGGEGLKKLYGSTLPSMLEAYSGEKMVDGVLPVTDKTPESFPLLSEKESFDANVLSSKIDDIFAVGRKNLGTALGALSSPKSKLHNAYVQYAPQWLSVAPLSLLRQTFGKNISQIKTFSDQLRTIVAIKEEIVSTSAVLHEKVITLAKAGVGVDAFNRCAATASFNRMIPWESLEQQEWMATSGTITERKQAADKAWKQAQMHKATGKSFEEAYHEAVDAYNNLKSTKLKEAYQKVVAHIRSIWTRERNNLLATIEAVTAPNTPERADMMMRFNASFSDIKGAYWPLSRFGDFILKFEDAGGFKWSKNFETIAERDQFKKDLIETGTPPEGFKESFKDKQPSGAVAVPKMLFDQLDKIVRAKFMAGIDEADEGAKAQAEARAQQTITDMTQIWLRWQPETSALKNSMRRKNIKGFDTDMMRGYLDYMQRHASNIAWSEQGEKINMNIQSLVEDIKKKAEAPGGSNTDMENHIVNDLRKRIQALRDARVGVIPSTLGKLGTAYYMTSPSIALVQMSQLFTMTLPTLTVLRTADNKFVGWQKASTALAAATKKAFSKKFTREAMFGDVEVNNVYDNLRSVVTDENRNTPPAKGKALGEPMFSNDQILKQIAQLEPGQVELLVLRESMARNLLDISAAHETYEIVRGNDPSRLSKKIFDLAMLPMSLSELTSRKAAILASFDLAKQSKKDFFAAMNEIAGVVDSTLYSYAKEEKGWRMQGGNVRVLMMFQHYRIMTAIRMALLFKDSLRGATPDIKQTARREFVGIMGMTAALAGTVGLPLANTLFAALSLVLGSDDEPEDFKLMYNNWLEEKLGKTGAGVAAYGLPTLAGMNISRRIGLADVYGSQAEPPSGMHGRDLAAWWAANQLGPVFSVGQGWVQGYDEMVNKGNYMKGLEVATPKPIRDVLKSIRVASDGLKNGQGRKILADEEIGPDEIIMMALGFAPDEITRAQDAENSFAKLKTEISERRGRLIRDAAKVIVESGDSTKALESIRAFNTKMPQFSISGKDIKPAIRKMILGETGATGKRDILVAAKYEVPIYSERTTHAGAIQGED